MAHNRDYGRLARIGLGTPQANPTAEVEFGMLLPAGVSMLTTRLTSRGEPEQRLLDYFTGLAPALASFDTLKLDAFAFACTGSSYLLDPTAEREQIDRLEQQHGHPIITAATAIRDALAFLGAQSIALACPYPQWLLDRAYRYWQSTGLQIVDSMSVQPEAGDTRSIYALQGATATRQIERKLKPAAADIILIAGTGMPGLQAIIDLQQATGKPTLTSNLCLAWSSLRKASVPAGERAADRRFPLLSGWQSAIRQL
ncbi:MAG: hypothetical protein GDA55_02840 [Cellvibrionales bacterium]|nr:hypothetical protein [Cellvibrionales bacterium]